MEEATIPTRMRQMHGSIMGMIGDFTVWRTSPGWEGHAGKERLRRRKLRKVQHESRRRNR